MKNIKMLPVDDIRPYHDSPFRLYEGEKLDAMVESIKEQGVQEPVIVLKKHSGYEMLSGHNRQKAARLAGLTEIPAIVKEGLSEEEAYIYVIETNLLQRSFGELLPSEKAAVMQAHNDFANSSNIREEILSELQIVNSDARGRNDRGYQNRDKLAEAYGYHSRHMERYLRINHLIPPLKELLDENRIGLVSACEVSYLSEEEQEIVYEAIDAMGVKLRPNMAKTLRKHGTELTENLAEQIIESMIVKKKTDEGIRIKLSVGIREKYFKGMSVAQITEIVEQALEAWFARKESGYVQ